MGRMPEIALVFGVFCANIRRDGTGNLVPLDRPRSTCDPYYLVALGGKPAAETAAAHRSGSAAAIAAACRVAGSSGQAVR